MNSTIKQRTCIVTIESQQPGGEPRNITIRRMAWSAQRQLLKSLALIVPKVLAPRAGAGPTETAPSLLAILAENMPAIVASSDDLANLLVMGSTGLSREEFDNLDSLAAAEVINQALALNFDDEVKSSVAAIVNKIVDLVTPSAMLKPAAPAA